MDRTLNNHFAKSHYRSRHTTGPVDFLNPTRRQLDIASAPQGIADSPDSEGARINKRNNIDGVYHAWRSRDNRKGRHRAVVTPATRQEAETIVRKSLTVRAQAWRGIQRMALRYPVWDVSYDVAIVFTLGSVIWVINAFFVWLPLAVPSSEFAGESSVGGGVTAFIGATVFEFGSILLMLEAVNENRSDCFGWAVEEAIESGSKHLRPDGCRHHHQDKHSLFKNHNATDSKEASSVDSQTGEKISTSKAQRIGNDVKSSRRWFWWPTWHELSTHYLRDIGFLACLSQMFGATVFWISGFTGLPSILDVLSISATNGAFWVPQVVGGTGFIVSSLLFMLECQKKWYLPALGVLGWHIGFWNFIGAIGFTLCGALGFASDQPGLEYASTLSTFIGSWAFLIGSIMQWYESLDKYPVTVQKTPPEEKKTGMSY